MTRAWPEGSTNASGLEGPGSPAQAGDVTWLHVNYNTQFWNVPGGEFIPSASASTMVNASGVYTWSSSDLLADLNAWLQDPGQNFGWILRGNEGVPQSAKRYASRENATVDARPRLTLTYAFLPEPTPHTVDQDGDFVVSLSELLRVIQFYNTGSLHCDGTTEDGFAPGPGEQSCSPHDSDYAPQNWIISLGELLRIIQFYNSGGYLACPDANTEDGYCAALL